ncbi:MAG TPA: hypothetical protein VI792_04095, partial [Candidatus Eisenbacteria bacterium]
MATALASMPSGASAQARSPYSDFRAMSLADMDSVRVKFTYGGPQDYIMQSIVIFKTGASPSIGSFAPYRRTGFEYLNDDGPVGAVGASRPELKALIDGVGRLERVARGGVDPG